MSAADLLSRLHACASVRDGRLTVHPEHGGYNLFATPSGLPVVRLRPTGTSDEVELLYPDPDGGWLPPGALGDEPTTTVDDALDAIGRCLDFLEAVASPPPPRRKPPRRRSPL